MENDSRLASAGCLLPPLPSCRQFDHKSRPARMIRFGSDPAAVLEYDPLHDRQPQAGPGTARRKIRLKKSFEVPGSDPMSSVSNFGNQ
jgi:hypothetical protein